MVRNPLFTNICETFSPLCMSKRSQLDIYYELFIKISFLSQGGGGVFAYPDQTPHWLRPWRWGHVHILSSIIKDKMQKQENTTTAHLWNW